MKTIIAILLVCFILCVAAILALCVLIRKAGSEQEDDDEINPYIRWPEHHEF